MPAVLDIINRGLDLLGQQPLTSMDERTPNAAKVKRVWPGVRASVLRAHVWKCAQERVELARLADRPAFGFSYQYQLPGDFVRLVATDPERAIVCVKGNTLMSDAPTLAIAYVKDVDDAELFDALLVECLAMRLAADLAFGITGSVQMRMGLEETYKRLLADARHVDATEGAGQQFPQSSWVSAKLGGAR